MPRSAGTYSLPAGSTATANTTIESAKYNAALADIATALTDSINKDGTKAWAADQPMGGFKLTNMTVGSARTDSISLGQAQDSKANWAVAGGTANALTLTLSPAVTALVDGQEVEFRAIAANTTTTPTLAVNGLTARTITKIGGAALAVGDIAGPTFEGSARYNLANTRWELKNPALAGSGTFTAVQTIAIADSGTNTVTDILKLAHSTSGTAAASFGAGLLYQLEDAAGTLTDAASIDAVWVDATNASEDSAISFKTMIAGSAKAEAARIAQGMTLGSPTGGDKGAGTINATAVYGNNVQLLPLVSGTSQASTSGTFIDFTSLPSTVQRVTISLRGVSTSGTDNLLVQIGDAGGVETTGYISTSSNQSGGATANSTAGLIITTSTTGADVVSGHVTLTLIDSATNAWACSSTVKRSTSTLNFSAGDKALSATLDRVRITTTGGTDTFDAGTINIMYE